MAMMSRQPGSKFFGYRLIILGVIAIGGLCYFWNSPLQGAERLPTPLPMSAATSAAPAEQPASSPDTMATPAASEGANDSAIVDSSPPSAVIGEPQAGPSAPSPSPTPITTPEPLCGGPPVMTILLVGSDSRDSSFLYGMADVIRVVRIDFITPRAVMLDFPRDLWVEIPGISDHYGITHDKLNAAYFYGNPGMGYYDGPAGGPGLLAQTLALNFGLQVDHYLALDTRGFVKVIDAVGGVDIYLAETVNANGAEPYAYMNPDYIFPPGHHHLNGQRALIFAEGRIPTTFQRSEHQDIILNALQRKLLSPAVLPRAPQLIAALHDFVRTDLSPSEISSLVCLAEKITEEEMVFASFPVDWFKPSSIYAPRYHMNLFIFDVDFEQLRSRINEFMNGTWPPP